MIDPGPWWLFPTSIAIATIGMTCGIGGAVFFSPLFMFVLGLDPAVAIGTALATQLFGSTSGAVGYARRRLIDYRVGRSLLTVALPAAVVGSMLAGRIPADLLKTVFALGLVFFAARILAVARSESSEPGGARPEGGGNWRELTDRRGRTFRYNPGSRRAMLSTAGVGGLFMGVISVGLAESLEYQFLGRARVPAPVAVATAIFVLAVSVLGASVAHVSRFATSADATVLPRVLGIVILTVPGAVIGGQIGPLLQARLDPNHIRLAIAVVFLIVGGLILGTTLT